jgi:ubiquinone/menaquinone biosynthesis C-methylase UbiE
VRARREETTRAPREDEIREWYDERHRRLGERAWRPPHAYALFLDYLDAVPGRRLLDVGCGTGYLLRAAEERGIETYGVDLSREGVKIARSIAPRSKIHVGRGEDLEFPDRFFDYVTCIGALEHFVDMGRGIREMVRVAKDGARFCVVVPNSNHLFWKIGTRGTPQRDINERLLSLKEWGSIFTGEGLDISGVYQDRWFAEQISLFTSPNPLEIMKRALRKMLWGVLPLEFTYQFIFLMQKGQPGRGPMIPPTGPTAPEPGSSFGR